MTSVWVAGIGVLITFSIFLSHVIFKLGHHSARLEALEKWRTNIRDDMHEISDKLESIASSMERLKALIEERTERRSIPRHDN